MLITYTLDQVNFPSLEVPEDLELQNFYSLVSMENSALSGINVSEVFLVVNGNRILLTPENLKKKITEVGISNNDLIYVGRAPRQPVTQRQTSSAGTSTQNPANLISQLVKSIKIPERAGQKRHAGPSFPHLDPSQLLADPRFKLEVRKMFQNMDSIAVQHKMKPMHPRAVAQYLKDKNDFEAFFNAAVEDKKDFFRRLQLTADPTSPEGQAMIAEFIRMEANQKQYEKAMTEMPESFIRSHMLYIKLKVNGVDTIAFVDSGAQVTTISRDHAEKFGLTPKVDTSFATVISGVGGQQLAEGRIHSTDIELNGHVIQVPMTVMTEFGENILIGLDTMRRHRAVIDLTKNCICFGDVKVPFLNEREYADECRKLGLKANLPPDYLEPMKLEEVDTAKVAHLVEMGYEAEAAAKALAKSHNDLPTAVQIMDTELQEEKAQKVGGSSDKI